MRDMMIVWNTTSHLTTRKDMFEPVAPAAYGWGGGSHTLSETVTLMTLSSHCELESPWAESFPLILAVGTEFVSISLVHP